MKWWVHILKTSIIVGTSYKMIRISCIRTPTFEIMVFKEFRIMTILSARQLISSWVQEKREHENKNVFSIHIRRYKMYNWCSRRQFACLLVSLIGWCWDDDDENKNFILDCYITTYVLYATAYLPLLEGRDKKSLGSDFGWQIIKLNLTRRINEWDIKHNGTRKV